MNMEEKNKAMIKIIKILFGVLLILLIIEHFNTEIESFIGLHRVVVTRVSIIVGVILGCIGGFMSWQDNSEIAYRLKRPFIETGEYGEYRLNIVKEKRHKN